MAKSMATQQLEQWLKFNVQCTSEISDVLDVAFGANMPDEPTALVIISHINKLLSTAANRNSGLALLIKVLEQCPPSLVFANAILWTNHCINSPKKSANTLRFNILAKIMEISGGIQDFDKSMVPLLPKVIDMCISSNPGQSINESTLECLRTCLLKYPSTCGPFKNKIESYLCKFFSCKLPLSTIKLAGSAFHLLQQVGGSGPGGITHITNWSNHFIKLCVTLHKLHDKFFVNITEFSSFQQIGATPFEIPQLLLLNGRSSSDQNASDISGSITTANITKNIVVFVSQMLIECYPVQKSVSVPQILDIIKRGLSVDVFQQVGESLEKTQFAALLYAHHIDLLYLLRSLIACFKQDLMPFSFQITKLLMDCLQRTQKDYFKNSSEYQKAVYKVLSYWIIIARNKLNSSVHSKLISHIVSEITPQKNSVELCLSDNVSQKKSAKAKRRAIQEIISKSNESAISDPQKALVVKEVVCLEALNVGNMILQHVILDLDRDVYQVLFETVTQHLIHIQGGKFVHPYTNPKCQAGLYRMLFSIFSQPDYCMAPLLEMGINLFVKGQSRFANTTNDDIFLVCTHSLDVLEKLCQATCPTLCINQFKGIDCKDKKKVEMDKTRVSDSHAPMTISLDIENVNTDAPDCTNVSPNTSVVLSSTTMKRINIIDVQIIKQANEKEDAGNSRELNTATNENATQDPEKPEEKDSKEHLIEVEHHESIKMEEEEEQETPAIDVLPHLKEEQLLDSLPMKTPPEETAVEEPPIKRSRSIIDDEEEAMLNSFTDVINEY